MTNQTVFYKTANDYKNIVGRRFIVYKGLTTNQRINLRSNVRGFGIPLPDRLLLNY